MIPGASGTGMGRGMNAWRDYPTFFWLVVAIGLTLVHPFVPDASWLMVHVVTLGALTHAVMAWSTHFTQTLLRTGPRIDGPATLRNRTELLHASIVLVLVGVPTQWWWLTLIGATGVVAAVLWHGVQLWRRLRTALPGRFRVVIHSYLVAAAWLPVGATFGVLLARHPGDAWRGRLLLAHTMSNLLGWIGLTVTATIITLWPTVLRTRLDPDAERRARTSLWLFGAGLATIVAGALAGQRWVAVAGCAVYLGGLLWTARSMILPARTNPPRHFAAGSLAAGIVWFAGGIVVVGVQLATEPDWTAFPDGVGRLAGVLVVGFALQTLLGALSYLVPTLLGGGPSAVRRSLEASGRWGVLRLGITNIGLVLSVAPVPSGVRVAVTSAVLASFAAGLVTLGLAIDAGLRARKGPRPTPDAEAGRAEIERTLHPEFPWSQVFALVILMALTVSGGALLQPYLDGGLASAPATSVAPTGKTVELIVTANPDMTFAPDRVEIAAGDRLVITLHNSDASTSHDLAFDTSHVTPRIVQGQEAVLDLGVVGGSRQGWCTVMGHKAMGMVFDIVVTGGGPAASASAPSSASAAPSAALRPGAAFSSDFTARDANLPTRPESGVHRLTWTITEAVAEVAPGVRQVRWLYDGQAPGPTLHGRVGDRFEVTIVNRGTMGHSIDFHAGEVAPDGPMRTIAPGASLTYTFTANRAGAWLYHCSTMPMSSHIAAGMHGAVIIEPDGLPAVDRSWVLVGSELYFGAEGGEVDPVKVAARTPDAMAFNGAAFQYDSSPLTTRVGERVRIWVVDAGPNRPMAFHIVGAQFDTVYVEGAYTLARGRSALGGTTDGGAQVLALQPAQGGFVELVFREAGHYPMVSHIMSDAEIGAHGVIEVTARRN